MPRLVLNLRDPSFEQELAALFSGAAACDIAVSYLKLSGWEILRAATAHVPGERIRLVCTDQFGLTHPDAVRAALNSGVQIRLFDGDGVFHPKAYISRDGDGCPRRAIVGSANISLSAFTTGIEAGIFFDDEPVLADLSAWFNELFENDAVPITAAEIEEIQQEWDAALAARAAAQLAFGRVRRRRRVRRQPPAATPVVEPEEIDAREDVFSSVNAPIAMLGIDQAGNNIRSLGLLRRRLSEYPNIDNKPINEFKLLGLRDENTRTLTPLGSALRAATTDEEVARLWCEWVFRTPDATLSAINPSGYIIKFKRAASLFWRLRPEVIEFFLTNQRSGRARTLLQCIEVLCNGSDAIAQFSLDDFRSLSGALADTSILPESVRTLISGYLYPEGGKGARSWSSEDRAIILQACRDLATA